MTPFMRFLDGRLDELMPHLRKRSNAGRAAPASRRCRRRGGGRCILQAIPGIELVDLQQPAVGLQSTSLSALPAFKRELQLNELQAARDAGVDALVTVYHSEHRELCAHERDWPFRIVNLLELVGESMGLQQEDRFKELKMMQDADLIISECSDLIARHALDPAKRATPWSGCSATSPRR